VTEVIDGLASGAIWSAILVPCLVATVAVVAAMVPASARARSTAAGTIPALDVSPTPAMVRPNRHLQPSAVGTSRVAHVRSQPHSRNAKDPASVRPRAR
jgi:hypothetical protein